MQNGGITMLLFIPVKANDKNCHIRLCNPVTMSRLKPAYITTYNKCYVKTYLAGEFPISTERNSNAASFE